ncbi:response regulator transcription factor [Geovibrio ferrireducens]|uniref:response regulator transcription factor n=1 Tax=Geovibrio ferrireducens TaxID=46201 RepID=UPI002247E059|nr:response regulator [Geovibrio ferrireducens]
MEADALTVLYVEDDFYVRESLLRLLRRRFSNVIEARDGREGLEMHRLHNPDFIITDIQMPIMDGLEMCERIMKERPDAKVIVTTAFNDREFISRAECLGVKAYISKPVMKDSLMNAIRAVLS